MSPEYLRASDGTGNAALAHIESTRAIGATVLNVDSVDNYPTKFIYTTGTVGADGFLVPASITEMFCHVTAGDVIIEGYMPGYTDQGNTAGQVGVIKQSTAWANLVADTMKNAQTFIDTNGDWRSVNDASGVPIIPTVVSNDGQKQHKIRFTGIDRTATVPVGAKMALARTGTTPTKSMAFVAASSQYAQKAGATGLGQTDDITFETDVYLDTYQSGGQNIAGQRTASTNGWRVLVEPSGQISVYGYNGATYRGIQTVQAIPLQKWTHLAFTLDLSGYTNSTCKIFFDGVEIPVLFVNNGTITSYATANTFALAGDPSAPGAATLNGKLDGARLWSVLRTPAQIRDNMNQELVGNEVGLVLSIKGNESWNDTTSNNNHLTASGGAVNNFAAHAFSAVEYAVATKIEYIGGNTDVTLFTGNGRLPNQVLAYGKYSTARAPYGFPADKTKWRVQSFINSQPAPQTAVATNTWYNVGSFSISIPVGVWDVDYRLSAILTAASAGYLGTAATLSTANNSETNRYISSYGPVSATASSQQDGPLNASTPLSISSQTPYYLNLRTSTTASSMSLYIAGSMPAVITAECAYI